MIAFTQYSFGNQGIVPAVTALFIQLGIRQSTPYISTRNRESWVPVLHFLTQSSYMIDERSTFDIKNNSSGLLDKAKPFKLDFFV